MADVTKTRRRKRDAGHDEPDAGNGGSDAARDDGKDDTGTLTKPVEDVSEGARGAAGNVTDTAGGAVGGVTGRGAGVVSELRDTVRQAALEVLKPLAREAATSAAKMAATKGPELLKDRVMPKVEEAGGPGELAKGALSKGSDVAGGLTEKIGRKKGKEPSGTGRGRRLPVQEHLDVAVDLQTAYDQWTQFEEFPRFMHRVEKVEQVDDTTLMWHENIWGVRRSWEAEITDQQPCERLAWRSTSGPKQIGVVTFHRISDRLTRVLVTLDFQPQGLFEKAASGMRITRRALRSDLMRFKAYIEMEDEATGAWRGRIEEGEVVESPGGEEEEEQEPEGRVEEEEADEQEDLEEEEPEEEEPDAAEEEEPEASEEEEDEEEDEEEEPQEVKPVRRRRVSRSADTATRKRR
jgi:uncharacterized membrane protein